MSASAADPASHSGPVAHGDSAAHGDPAAHGDSAAPSALALGRLDAGERAATLASLAAAQHATGFIPHARGRPGDPWNHLEVAMALTSGGRLEEADRALAWSLHHQRPDGSWPAELGPAGEPFTARVDTNCVAYLAVAAWHRYLVTGDGSEAARLLPAVDRALGLVLACQQPDGAVAWEIDASGRPGRYALVTASSSIHQSLLAGAALAGVLGAERPRYLAAAARLQEALAGHLSGGLAARPAGRPRNFADKREFAMDWYYPVLAGVLPGARGEGRLRAERPRFVLDGLGVRCRSDGRWVTTAETAECALAYGRVGDRGASAALLAATHQQRLTDGSYLTGLVHPERSEFPPGERTTYSAAAVLLADEALRGGPAAVTFGWPDAS